MLLQPARSGERMQPGPARGTGLRFVTLKRRLTQTTRKADMLASLALATTLATGSMNGITLTPAAIKATEAVATSSSAGIVRFGNTIGRGNALATPYITNDPNGHAWTNGRLWQSRNVFIGPGPVLRDGRANCEEPGPAAYGVSQHDRTTILVQVGTQKIGISPWQRLEGRALRRLEDARNQWLYERGYFTGVRTFVNDAYAQPQHTAARELQPHDDALTLHDADSVKTPVRFEDIQPRATIRIPADAPRFRKRMQVQSSCQPVIVLTCSGHRTGEKQVTTVSGRGNSREVTRVVSQQSTIAAAE